MEATPEAFGIVLPRKGSAPLDDPSHEAIEHALQAGIANAGLSLEDILTRPKYRQQVLKKTCDVLVSRNNLAEALIVADARKPELARLRLRAQILTELGDVRGVRDAVRQIETLTGNSLREQLQILKLRKKMPVLLRPRDHRIFGRPLERIEDQLHAIPEEIGATSAMDKVANRLIAARAIPDREADSFRDKARWGFGVAHYLSFLAHYRFAAAQTNPSYDDHAQIVHERILSLAEQAETRLPVVANDVLERERDAGRAILLLQAHAGMQQYLVDYSDGLNMQTIAIAADADTMGQDSPLITRLTPVGNAQMTLMKAVMAARRTRHLVRISPDGPFGEDRIEGQVLGVPVSIGAGAGLMGWYAKADAYFGYTRWREDGRFELDFIPGPRAEDFAEKHYFEEALAAFYFDCLKSLALGDPRNIGTGAGFWAKFHTP